MYHKAVSTLVPLVSSVESCTPGSLIEQNSISRRSEVGMSIWKLWQLDSMRDFDVYDEVKTGCQD